MAAAGLSWLPRGMGFSPGEESRAAAVAAQAIEAQPSFGQIKPLRGRVAARRTARTGEDLAGVGCRAQEARRSRCEVGRRGAHIGQAATCPNHGICDASVHRSCRPVRLGPTSRSRASAVPLPRQSAVLVTPDLQPIVGEADDHPCLVAPANRWVAGLPSMRRPSSGGMNSAIRAQAVPPTATAPISAKVTRQPSDGMPIWAKPSVPL